MSVNGVGVGSGIENAGRGDFLIKGRKEGRKETKERKKERK